MDTVTQWAIQLVIEILIRLGPRARKYLDALVQRFMPEQDDFEIEDMKLSIDVVDRQGDRAIFKKEERLRFLRDNVTAIYDYGWGTREPFASHRVKPGRLVERRQIGLKHRSLVVLPEPQNQGDKLTLTVRRLIRAKFTGPNNWLEGEVYYRMRRMQLSVTVPIAPPITGAKFIRRRQSTEVPLSVQLISRKRQRIRASIVRPRIGDSYLLEWDW